MRIYLVLIVLVMAKMSFGVVLTENYDWKKTFDPTDYLEDVDHSKEATVLFNKSLFYYYAENQKLALAHFEHVLIWIEDEVAIEKLNEWYLPNSVLGFKARIINSEGAVVQFNDLNIVSVSANEGSVSYQKLVLPGLEPECWVEIFYKTTTLKTSSRTILDGRFFTRLGQVVVSNPSSWGDNFEITFNCSGGYAVNSYKISESSSVYEVRNSESHSGERYANTTLESPRCDFYIGKKTWKDWSNLVLESIIPYSINFYISPISRKLVKIDAMDGDEVDKIKKIDSFIRNNIVETDQSDSKYSDEMKKILKTGIANDDGIISLMFQMFQWSDVKFELLITTNRGKFQLAQKMPCPNGLANYIFYFPKLDLYMLPNHSYYSLGEIPAHFSGLMALKVFSNVESVKSKLVKLPNAKQSHNAESTVSIIKLDTDLEECEILQNRKFYGDCAIRMRGRMNKLSEEEKQAKVKDYLLGELKTGKIIESKVSNESVDHNFYEKDTLEFSGTIESDDLLNPISDGLLINFPMLIGAQAGFYSKELRQNRIYIRESKIKENIIKFQIPEGYKLQNIENLIFSKEYAPDNPDLYEQKCMYPVAYFTSTAIILDGELTITVHEFYEEGVYPKADIARFQEIINASYEFYIAKVILIKK